MSGKTVILIAVLYLEGISILLNSSTSVILYLPKIESELRYKTILPLLKLLWLHNFPLVYTNEYKARC